MTPERSYFSDEASLAKALAEHIREYMEESYKLPKDSLATSIVIKIYKLFMWLKSVDNESKEHIAAWPS